MSHQKMVLGMFFVTLAVVACSPGQRSSDHSEETTMEQDDSFPISKSEEEWREMLSEDEYYILREQGTEPAGSGDLLDVKENGVYTCAGCGRELFHSDAKFHSGTGWPSFWEPISGSAVEERPDPGLLGTRTEIICAQCGGHLGHVFEDGPEPTGLRYCINSLALDFEKQDQSTK